MPNIARERGNNECSNCQPGDTELCSCNHLLQQGFLRTKAAQRLAKEDGVSLNQWIAAAVAEKVGAVETAAEFFKRRAGKV
jgi:hypothetical protein